MWNDAATRNSMLAIFLCRLEVASALSDEAHKAWKELKMSSKVEKALLEIRTGVYDEKIATCLGLVCVDSGKKKGDKGRAAKRPVYSPDDLVAGGRGHKIVLEAFRRHFGATLRPEVAKEGEAARVQVKEVAQTKMLFCKGDASDEQAWKSMMAEAKESGVVREGMMMVACFSYPWGVLKASEDNETNDKELTAAQMGRVMSNVLRNTPSGSPLCVHAPLKDFKMVIDAAEANGWVSLCQPVVYTGKRPHKTLGFNKSGLRNNMAMWLVFYKAACSTANRHNGRIDLETIEDMKDVDLIDLGNHGHTLANLRVRHMIVRRTNVEVTRMRRCRQWSAALR